MKILYLGEDPVAEYYEVKLFTELGHSVFSIGEQSLDTPPQNRTIPGHIVDQSMVAKFLTLHPNYQNGGAVVLNKEFIKHFDLIILSHFHTHLTMNWSNLTGKKVVWVWRTRPRSSPQHYFAVNHMKGRGLKTVELPRAGHYKIDECNEIWTEFFNKLQS